MINPKSSASQSYAPFTTRNLVCETRTLDAQLMPPSIIKIKAGLTTPGPMKFLALFFPFCAKSVTILFSERATQKLTGPPLLSFLCKRCFNPVRDDYPSALLKNKWQTYQMQIFTPLFDDIARNFCILLFLLKNFALDTLSYLARNSLLRILLDEGTRLYVV